MSCPLCGVASAHPELVVAQTARWLLVGFAQRFTPGTLLLTTRAHLTLGELDGDLWTEAAPLLATGTRLVERVGGAQKVYLGSFGEHIEHFHLVLLCKRAEDEAAHEGKRAAALFDAIATGPPPDRGEVLAWVERYRESVG